MPKLDPYIIEFLQSAKDVRVEVCGSKMKERVYVNVYYKNGNDEDRKHTRYVKYANIAEDDIFLNFVVRHPNMHLYMSYPPSMHSLYLGLKNTVTKDFTTRKLDIPLDQAAESGSMMGEAMKSMYLGLY